MYLSVILLLLLPVISNALIPSFFLGKPFGHNWKNVGLDRRIQNYTKDDYPHLQTKNFTQILDHFNDTDKRVWNQKYYYNPVFSKNKNIIFLMIGGEGPENGKWASHPDIQYLQWAKQYGADVFDLEHRFFGDSWPLPDMSVDSLKYLTTKQALADIANFIKAMNKEHKFVNPKWVTFGGSYPGSLSAWFRAKYPELTVGAVASSAPLNLKLDFYEYAMVVEDDLRLTDPKCADAVKDAFTKMQDMSIREEGRNELNDIFNLIPKFDNNTSKLDITNFFANLYNVFQGMTQYTYDGQSESTHVNKTVSQMCHIMTDEHEKSTVKRVANLFLWFNKMEPMSGNLSVLPNSYSDVIAAMKKTNIKELGEDGASSRGWMWLCCNEIGFLQTTDQGKNVFGATVPLNYFIDMCTDMFDSTIDINHIYENNRKAQEYYGGSEYYNATNIVLPNGSLDPWHALGTYNQNVENSMIPLLINGTAHCADMYPSYDGEPKALKAARETIKKSVESFIESSGSRASLLGVMCFLIYNLL